MRIIIEHIRSISKRQNVPLRPLTLLVGENSSGKTTFLAAVSAVLDEVRFPTNPAFNEAPFNLGTFETIATYKGGKYGRDKAFSIGFESGTEPHERRSVVATYANDFGNVILRRLKAKAPTGTVDLELTGSRLTGTVRFASERSSTALRLSAELRGRTLAARRPFRFQLMNSIYDALEPSERRAARQEQLVWPLLRALEPPFSGTFSLSPIRSKPRRTYDEFSEEYSPEGDHIPTLLARLLSKDETSAEARRVHQALIRFGDEAGLFGNVRVKRLGRNLGDPFQLQVSIAGPAVNLADVGYGVSQALPIAVQSVLKAHSRMLLLQQPEVHLHPRAQAALGTFFSELAAKDDRWFLVETHSDHLVDRVRQEVAQGTIRPDDVLILFFEKPKAETRIWSITLDQHGNIAQAPASYRSFFLEEEIRLFQRTSA